MADFEDIPDFLKVSQEKRAEAWREYQRTKKPTATTLRRARRKPWGLPKTVEAAGLAIARQEEANRKARQAARLAALKESKRK